MNLIDYCISIKDIPQGTKLIITGLSKVGLRSNRESYGKDIGKEVVFSYTNLSECGRQAPACIDCEFKGTTSFIKVDNRRVNQPACYYTFKTLT
jgi:hypothetical protein